MLDKLQEAFHSHYRKGDVLLIHADCMDVMAMMPDKEVDLAVVDPPYGIGFDGEISQMANNNSKKWKNAVGKGYERKSWDKNIPSDDYFSSLSKVSLNQVIWGGNYFKLNQSSGWIFWDKGTADNFTLSPGELAWTSFSRSLKKVSILWAGFRKIENDNRIHPTQKPIALYKWLYANYAKPGQLIFDSHGGSFSSAIAAHYYGVKFIGCELDESYFNAAVERFKQATAQVDLMQEFS